MRIQKNHSFSRNSRFSRLKKEYPHIGVRTYSPQNTWGIRLFLGSFFLIISLLFTLGVRADFTFTSTSENLTQNINTTLSTNATGITGTHDVTITFTQTGGNLDRVTVYDNNNNPIVLTESNSPQTIITGHDFDANDTISFDVEPYPKKYGEADLTVSANGEIGSIHIDTRFSEAINIHVGQEFGTDPYAGILDFIGTSEIGVGVTPTHVTGMIWSDNFGWIDMQPQGGGVITEILDTGDIQLSGLAWNEQIGWIDFGSVEATGGVTIDSSGYFQGTAWSEHFGALSFGEYMALDPILNHNGTFVPVTTEWAQTSWAPTNDHVPTVALISPADEALLATRTPLFVFHIEDEDEWNDVGFDIRVTQQTPQGWVPYLYHEEPATLRPNGPDENHTYGFSQELQPGYYRWEMHARDQNGIWSESSGVQTFTVGNTAPVVTLLSPDDGSIITGGRRPTFSFEIADADDDAIQYTVQISTESDFSTILSQSSAESSLISPGSFTYTPVTDLPGGVLYWRAMVQDGFGRGPNTTPFQSFTIQNTIPQIQEISLRDDVNSEIPNGGTTQDITPSIQWESVDPDSIFVNTTVQVFEQGEDPDTATPTWNNNGQPYNHILSVQNRTIGPLATGDYFYRIRTCDADNACSGWAQANFSIDARSRFGNVGTLAIETLYPTAMIGPATGHIPFDTSPDIHPSVLDDDSTDNKYASSTSVGLIDMNPVGGGVIVENNRVRGYAWNNILGWIRMSCEAFDGEASAGYECDTYNYGVTNLNGELSGTALIESTGKYIYFSGTAFGDPGNTEIDVDISCEPNYEGHFLGKAWAPDIGWISFGRQELYDDLISAGETPQDAADKAADIFPMTEWSCGAGTGPILESINKYVVFGAQEEDFSFPIAQKNTAPFSSDVACGTNDGSQSTQVRIQKINPDGTVQGGVTLSDGNNFSLGCVNTNNETDGKAWLTLHGDALNNNITTTPGLYRIVGDIADGGGAITSFPETGTLEEQYIIQVVAGAPDLTMSEAGSETIITTMDNDGAPIADGNDAININIRLFDRFGNRIQSTYKYEDNTKNLLKSAEVQTIFWDDVFLDQLEGFSSVKDATIFTAPVGNTDIQGSKYEDNGHPVHRFYDTSDTPELNISIQSIAPSTSGTNTLLFRQIRAKVEQQDISGYTGPRNTDGSISVGQTINTTTGSWTEHQVSNSHLSFLPIINSSISGFEEFSGTNLNTRGFFPVTLRNQSDTKTIYYYDWLGIARTIADGNRVSPEYMSTSLRDTPTDLTGTPEHNHWQEVSSGGNFDINSPTEFSTTIERYIPYSVIESESLEKTIHSDQSTYSTFSNFAGGGSINFQFSATPTQSDDVLVDGRTTQFLQFIALNIDKQGETKTVKYPLQSYASFGTSDTLKLSISGSTYGEEINERVIVSESAAFDEYSNVDDIYTRQKIQEIIYTNYKSLTGIRERASNTTVAGNKEVETFDDYSELTAERNTGSNRWLQSGKVMWFKRDPNNSSLSVVLGSNAAEDMSDPSDTTLYIPDAPVDDPITIVVEGGNIFIKDNIKLGQKRNIGIISLSSRENAKTGTEGNIFIDPSVTSLEGVFYADGSVMSAKDIDGDGNISETEIYDGFNATGMSATDLSNQIYIRGSVVSMNTAGTLSLQDNGSYELPKDAWLPAECNPFTNCTDDEESQIKTAMRYDFAHLRRFGLSNEYDEPDTDYDTIKNSADCDSYADGETLPSGCQRALIGGEPIGPMININCETFDEFTGLISPITGIEGCQPIVTSKVGSGGGQCAPETSWCTCTVGEVGCVCPADNPSCSDGSPGVNTLSPFAISCEDDIACNDTGRLVNQRIGASVIIDYSPLVQKITPVGMELPKEFNFSKE